MPRILLICLALMGCTDPRLLAGVSIGSDGVAVFPAISGTVGGATVSISP